MRIEPRFPLSELGKATIYTENDSVYDHPMVKKYKRSKAMEEFMPLTILEVVKWLKTLRFRQNPHVRFKVSILPCGKLVTDENTD